MTPLRSWQPSRRRQTSTFSRVWPAIIAVVIAINLIFVAKSVISKLPQSGFQVVKKTTSSDSITSTDDTPTSIKSIDSPPKPTVLVPSPLPPKPKRSCHTEQNAEYYGSEAILDGSSFKTNTADECCMACHERKECNVWVWCADPQGCHQERQHQECWLKLEPELNPVNPQGLRGPNIRWISGISVPSNDYKEAQKNVDIAEKKEQQRLLKLKANQSLPLVFFDVEIKKKPVGRIEMVLYPDTSPRSAENFRQLCTGEAGIVPEGREGSGLPYHFKGAFFYRIIHQFIDQAGVDVESVFGGHFKDDAGGLKLKHEHKGLLSMANMGPDTNTAHFSIMMGPSPHLDGSYTIFGQVVTGFDTVDIINALSIGKPENTATAEEGVVIADCGQIRKGTIVPNLEQDL